MKQLINFFQDKKVSSVLDLGTGSGDFIEVLKAVFPKGKITGVDPNKEALKAALEKYPDVLFQEMKGETLAFNDNLFDVASISMALHHLSDIQKSLEEMQRVVKSGGWIIVSELFSDNLNPAQEVHKMYHHFRSKIDRIIGVSHNRTFKRNEIIETVKNAGIQIQLSFDFDRKMNPVLTKEDLEERIIKMHQILEQIKGKPEFETLKPIIEEFRKKALKFGFQPATRVVIVGKVR